MGLFTKSPTPADKVIAALAAFKCIPDQTDAKLRDTLTTHLSDGGFVAKRSAGLHGESQRVDIFFEHGEEDYHLLVRSKLSDARAKTVLGEFVIAMQAVILSDHARAANLMLIVADEGPTKVNDGPFGTVHKGVTLLNLLLRQSKASQGVHLHLGFAVPGGVAMMPLAPE